MATMIEEMQRQQRINQIPVNGYPKAPAADGSQNNPLNTEFGRNLTNTLSALPGAGAFPNAAAGALAASAPAASLVGRVAQGAAPYAPAGGGAAALMSSVAQGASMPSSARSSDGPLARAATMAPPPVPTPSLVSAIAPNPTDQRLAAGTQAAPPSPTNPLVTAASNQIMPGVYQHGRGQYSDNPSGMGMSPSLGHPSAANIERADSLISRLNTSAPSASSVFAGTPLVQAAGLIPEGSMAILGGNGFGLRDPGALAERNALVSAGSLLAAKERAGDTSSRRGGQPGVASADVALSNFYRNREQGNELGNNLQIQDMRNTSDLARTGMQEQGSNARALLQGRDAMARTQLQEQGLNARSALETAGSVQAAQLRADASGKGAPSGYRFKADGTGLEFIPGGPADPNTPKGKNNLNETQAKALQFGTRMQEAGRNLDALAASGTDQPSLIKRAADAMGAGIAANWAQSPQQQQVEQSQRDFVNAVLRRESGAAISESEFASARQQYFPQPGDSAQVIEQKRRNREIATSGLLAEVPNSESRVQQILGSVPPAPGQQSVPAASGGQVGDSPQIAELRRRAAGNPDLARRLQGMGY